MLQEYRHQNSATPFQPILLSVCAHYNEQHYHICVQNIKNISGLLKKQLAVNLIHNFYGVPMPNVHTARSFSLFLPVVI